MTFRYEEIGQRLKAFRMGSGLGADEIARKIGISRTALYRFERGELAKIDTLAKFAELLGVSTATLLGVGIEYIPSAVSYFERIGRSRRPPSRSSFCPARSPSCWHRMISRPPCRRC